MVRPGSCSRRTILRQSQRVFREQTEGERRRAGGPAGPPAVTTVTPWSPYVEGRQEDGVEEQPPPRCALPRHLRSGGH